MASADHQHHHKKNPLSRFFPHRNKNKKLVVFPEPEVIPPPRAAVVPVLAAAPTTTRTAKNIKPQADEERLKETKKSSSWLCRTKMFQGMIANAFELVDQDGSGTIDEKELYSGLLLIHLKLGTYAGPAACKPISRDKCHAVFVKMDADGSGHLDRDEFEAVMMVLFGNVMMRVAIQYACTLLIVPMIAQLVLNGISWIIAYSYYILSTLDEHNEWANTMELTLEHLWSLAIDFWGSKLPQVPTTVLQDAFQVVHGWIQAIPESVWNTIPLTLLSTVLSLMLIPWSLLQIDDFFQRLAAKSNNNNNSNNVQAKTKTKTKTQ